MLEFGENHSLRNTLQNRYIGKSMKRMSRDAQSFRYELCNDYEHVAKGINPGLCRDVMKLDDLS